MLFSGARSSGPRICLVNGSKDEWSSPRKTASLWASRVQEKHAGPMPSMASPPARNLQLYTIYLLTAAHGTGLGQSMIEAVVGDAPAQLWVLRANDRAIAFYKRNGFAADGVEFTDSAEPNRAEIRMVR